MSKRDSKPLKLPLDTKDALRALLQVKPSEKSKEPEKGEKKPPRRPKDQG